MPFNQSTANRGMNVFTGDDAVRDFMNPGELAYLPLVEIPAELNPFRPDGVRILAKLMTFTTLHNVKAVPAFNMIASAHERGDLEGVHTVIENSSGNTVTALAVASRLFGIDDVKAIVPTEATWQKLQMLRFFGIEPIVNQEPDEPNRGDPRSGIYKAKEIGSQPGWFNPGQYDNPDNPKAHVKWIGPQIWEQTEGRVGVFCGALGTTGTIIGNSTYLKGRNDDVQVVGVMRAPDNYVPGPRTRLLLQLIGFDWRPHVDSVQRATTVDSYRTSMELSRAGIYVGPSAGLSLVGLLHYLADRREEGTLSDLLDDSGELICVFVCPDTPIPYFEEYFKYLGEDEFPRIANEELLHNRPRPTNQGTP